MMISNKVTSILFSILLSTSLFGQQFIVADGAISNTASDSRSVNFLDINNDGWEDIYISNGLSGGQKDFLYINNGAGEMQAITDMEVVQLSNPSDGASFADYNNDGHIDGMISSWHGKEDVLYLNDGSGVLNYKANAGIVSGSYGETAAFGDYDNDGWLDLYISNSGGSSTKNYLYKNLKNEKFERIENHVLVSEAKLSRGVTWVDYNNDNKLDLFVANESNEANDLYLGIGGGNFEKVMEGEIVNSEKGSMTASWADINNDGYVDLFVGNAGYFQVQKNQIFMNSGTGFIEELTDPVVQKSNCTYGSAFADYDNDGDLDLLIANGYCNSALANNLYENDGLGNFENVSHLLPENAQICSFGVAWGDINNDGFPDAMIANCRNSTAGIQHANQLLVNQGNENNWLKVKLTGSLSNKNAIGAKVRVKATIDGKEVWQLRQINAQSGYAGQNSMIAHFGLGDATTVDSIEVIWPAGGNQYLSNVSANQQVEIEESLVNAINHDSQFEKSTMLISPNPIDKNAGQLQVSITHQSAVINAQLMIYDSLGQLLIKNDLQLKPDKAVFQVDIENQNFVPGIYAFVLQIGDRKIKEMLVVQ